MPESPGSQHLRPYFGVGLGVTITSTAAILIRLAQSDTHSFAVAAWRLTLASTILAPIALIARGSELRGLMRRERISVVGAGAFLALHFATWITSLAHTSVAASAVLVSTSPIFVGLASHVLLRERLSRAMIVALIIATGGSVLIGLGDAEKGGNQLAGDLLALMGAIAAAGYFVVGRQLRARLSLLGYVFPVYATAALLLMALLLLSGLPPIPARPQAWLWIVLLALGPQIIGHSALNWALHYLSATYVTIAIMAEPVISTLLARSILREEPSVPTVIGGAFILTGIAIASLAEQRQDGTAVA